MPLDIQTTQFPGGVGTVGDASILNAIQVPLPVGGAVAVEDFLGAVDYGTGWETTPIAGGATPSGLASSNGVLRLTTGAALGDGAQVAATSDGNLPDNFLVQSGVPAWIAARLAISDAIESEWILGFVPAAGLLAPADGVYLTSLAASGDVNIVVANSGASTETQLVGTLDAGALDFTDIALYWDGLKASAQFPGGGGSFIPDSANVPTVGLNATLTVAAGNAGAVDFDADWIAFGGGR